MSNFFLTIQLFTNQCIKIKNNPNNPNLTQIKNTFYLFVFIKKIHCSDVVYISYKTLLDIMCLYYNNIDSSDINLS